MSLQNYTVKLLVGIALIIANPFISEMAQASARDADQEMVVLQDLEQSLVREKVAAENSGRTANQLRASVYRLLDGMSEQEFRSILEIGPDQASTIDPAKLERVQEAERLAIEWDRAEKKYQTTVDDLTNRELDFFIKSTMLAMRQMKSALDESQGKGDPAQMEIAVKNYESAKKSFAAYVLARKGFGGPKDGPKRTGPYREFFNEAKIFFDSVPVAAAESSQPAKSFWTKLKEKASGAYIRAQLVVRVLPPVLKSLIISWTIPKSGPGEAPLQTRGFHKTLRAVKEVAGYEVEIEGREFLPKGGPLIGKTVNLIVPTHRNPILDHILMSEFDLQSYLLVMAPLPLLGEVDSVVAVKHGADPVAKILTQLSLGKTDTVFIYPEGSVGAGLFETRPVREKFVWGLVMGLKNAGYDVNLIPVTYLNSGRFVDESSMGDFFKSIGKEKGTVLKAKVSEPIDGRLITLLENVGSHSAVGRFIRATWLETLPTDKEFLNGVLRVMPANERFQQLLKIPRPALRVLNSCQEVFGG